VPFDFAQDKLQEKHHSSTNACYKILNELLIEEINCNAEYHRLLVQFFPLAKLKILQAEQ
jgi:hypothetical protein